MASAWMPIPRLIWSPSHFTWMDTNYPAGTPREGYPVEIQVLWIRLLRQLEQHQRVSRTQKLARPRRPARGFVGKIFLARRARLVRRRAASATRASSRATRRASDALRSNCLFAVSLGLVTGERAQRCVEAAQQLSGRARRHCARSRRCRFRCRCRFTATTASCLNNPPEPYWPRYEGDEDTRRKPAYHNGTAWTWTFPVFCEALARAWDFSPEAVAAARAYLGSWTTPERRLPRPNPRNSRRRRPAHATRLRRAGWGVTEALRVWKLLQNP